MLVDWFISVSIMTCLLSMGRLARKEMEARHARLDKRQVMILTEMNQSTNILNKITMLCPGLVVLYDSNKESEEIVPEVGPHTVLLRLERPLFSTTSPSLSQCLLTAHLSSSPGPRALSLSTILSNRHHLSPVLLLSLPVTVNLARKVRNLNTRNTVHTEKDVTELVGRARVREVRLETEESEAQARLARELISRELEQDIQLYFNTDHLQAPNVYEDLDTFLIVVTDPNSDNYVQKMVDRFLAKVFRPLKVSWIKLVNF